ncbi:hypothetical protein HHL16_00920 [Pseudoflavitalea sp. G-6-1-2]|uniref:M949_RS01915 family surface polysaccharide biosynthesis protein n=1 Tax=Pseudoflavitalea sp. G-6-1-2 TaxID=2728841 RepID=UPI00146E946D|nr:hypothetical protein [Pseudoflavitalea sp. G-6-1-2]NML19409.1 hypothetical protein [Pseudoflavitalea sp. G-6-1-2]
MKKICLILLALTGANLLSAQISAVTHELVSPSSLTWLTDSLKQVYRLSYPVSSVHHYTDQSGNYYCVFTESLDSVGQKSDSFHYRIRAVNLKLAENGQYSKVWDMNDYVLQRDQSENTIWFWKSYIAFEDIDKDGLADPLIVYGTTTNNGLKNGRVKCMIFYKGEKIGVRHQNGLQTAERNTTIDKSFYAMPAPVQLAVSQRMELWVKNQEAIFSTGWQKSMKSKRTYFDEKNQ